MNGMNEAITSLPFCAGISFGMFSRAMEIDSESEDDFYFIWTQKKGKVTEIFCQFEGQGMKIISKLIREGWFIERLSTGPKFHWHPYDAKATLDLIKWYDY